MFDGLLPNPSSELAAVVLIGILGQWLGWRLQIPAVLPLLVFGLAAGPITRLIEPDRLFGPMLLPAVSLAVALVLFEGGLSLRMRDLPRIRRVIWPLLSVGVLANGTIIGLAAHLVAGMPGGEAALLGAVLTVTGPTVIGPLLRHVRPKGHLGSILRWEGIIVDPIGALLAVMVFEAVAAPSFQAVAGHAVSDLAEAVAAGLVTGLFCGWLLTVVLRRSRLPEYLHAAVTVALAVGSLAGANMIQPESGLIAVTVMGLFVGNQRRVDVKHIVEFNESVGVIIIAVLFVVLSARIDPSAVLAVGWRAWAFLAVVLFVARPASVFLSTARSRLEWRERLFLSLVAPRGIVAATISSVLALELADRVGLEGPSMLVPLTFLVIAATVTISSLGAAPLARWLGLAERDPQGFLIVGAHDWAVELALALEPLGARCLVVDSNPHHAAQAAMRGVTAQTASILGQELPDRLDLHGIGRLLALTPNDEVNSLACLHFDELFGDQVYQLPEPAGKVAQPVAAQLRGRTLFTTYLTFDELEARHLDGWRPKATALTKEFGWEQYRALYAERFVPLFVASQGGRVAPVTAGETVAPKAGQTIISLVRPE